MPIFAVNYAYLDDAAKLDTIRPVHREYLATLASQNINLLSGPLVTGSCVWDG